MSGDPRLVFLPARDAASDETTVGDLLPQQSRFIAIENIVCFVAGDYFPNRGQLLLRLGAHTSLLPVKNGTPYSPPSLEVLKPTIAERRDILALIAGYIFPEEPGLGSHNFCGYWDVLLRLLNPLVQGTLQLWPFLGSSFLDIGT